MDKNFISVDDLVRQRLGGGEEQERAGSWMRMRELLDKEMPQTAPVGFNWRRMFSAVALLLLVGGIGLGGYEWSAYKNNQSNLVADIHTNTATSGTAANSTNAVAGNNTSAVNHASVAASSEQNKDVITNTQVSGASSQTSNAAPVVASVKQSATTHSKTTSSRDRNNIADEPMLASNTNMIPHRSSRKIKEVVAPVTNLSAAPATIAKNDDKTIAVAKTEDKTNPADAATTPAKEAVANNTTKTGDDIKTVTGKATAVAAKPTAVNKANNAVAAKVPAKNPGTANTSAPATDKPVAAVNGNDQKKTGRHSRNHNNPKVDELALNSSAPATNNTPNPGIDKNEPVKHNDVSSPRKLASKGNTTQKKPAATAVPNNGATVAANPVSPKPTGRSARKTAGTSGQNNTTLPLAATASVNISNNNNPVVRVARKGTRQVQQLTLSQHFIRTSPTTGYMHMDTISQEIITQEYDLAESNTSDNFVFGPPPYDKPGEAPRSHTVVTIVSPNKRNSGSSTMENLSAAFNDVKNKVNGVHFATGLTAGINGTFFGPNSFKGFQFGVTGTFTFSDKVAVMSELKYVHRINNDYSLYDNYYDYTPNTAGGYTKELVVNPYSFSTLHSFELPISLRYCLSGFNFFVGGNFVYTFAVNTGAYPLADPTTATQVSTVGNDNLPKLKADDFGARFGIGYLFGASYNVTPNVMLDARAVQTFWDNSNTAGAKIISGQLYRSPSIQMSIGYRLGSDKKRNAE